VENIPKTLYKVSFLQKLINHNLSLDCQQCLKGDEMAMNLWWKCHPSHLKKKTYNWVNNIGQFSVAGHVTKEGFGLSWHEGTNSLFHHKKLYYMNS